MVRMCMGDQQRVDLLQPQRQQLIANVRPGIDKNIGCIALYQNCAALPAIARILRVARPPARTANGGDSDRRSASQKRNLHPSPILENNLRVFARVAAAISSTLTPRSSASLASVWLV